MNRKIFLPITLLGMLLSGCSSGVSSSEKFVCEALFESWPKIDFFEANNFLYLYQTSGVSRLGDNSESSILLSQNNRMASELRTAISENDDEDQFADESDPSPIKSKPGAKKSKTPVLDNFGRDLTAMAEENKLDPVVGRESEILRVSQILSRRNKNNPLLIGEPGVGKSAIAEGLAIRIIKRNVSRVLFNKRVVTLDLAGLVA